MEIQIGTTKYRVCIRRIIRIEIRTRENRSRVVASGEAICRPDDYYDQRKGKLLAFKKAVKALPWHLSFTKDLRRAIWQQFLGRLDGKPVKVAAPEPEPVAVEVVLPPPVAVPVEEDDIKF